MSDEEELTLQSMQVKDAKRCPNCQIVVEKDVASVSVKFQVKGARRGPGMSDKLQRLEGKSVSTAMRARRCPRLLLAITNSIA